MKLTRRQGLLALGAALGGVLLKASPFARLRALRAMPVLLRGQREDVDLGTRRVPSLRVQPDPHSVKRHG